ncbi:MAG: flagellin [Lachnospiraceae bacterium]|nr:flagellin [Lachnospiraceae bacterium]
MRINHNSLALNASDHFATINKNIAKSMERLSSGYKITSPADDAAGLAISVKMSSQIRGLDRASLNSNDGISVIQSAEGGMNEIHSILGRMRELAVQAANDVNSEEDRDAIQEEINALIEELNQITETTTFNGQELLNGDLTRKTLSSDYNVQTTYLSEEVNEGVYELKISAMATQAAITTGLFDSGDTITEEQAGTIHINGFMVEIEEGMTMTDVFSTLQTHLSKIDVDVFASPDGGATEADFSSGATVMFRNQHYGSEERLEIGVSNEELGALLGLTDGQVVYGTDCQATLTVTDEGFSASATIDAYGNDLVVTDRNGFEMKITADPDTLEEGTGTVEIEVFSAGIMVIQSGAYSGDEVHLDIPKMDAKSLGVDKLIMYTNEYASEAIEAIDEAVKMVSDIRSKMGAYENRLNDVYSNLEVQEESITAAYSRMIDTDMAEEMTNYTQQDVLAQAAISMMQKSNERPASVLQLLQN